MTASSLWEPYAMVDVHYFDDATARAACIAAQGWGDAAAIEEQVVDIPTVAPYVSGRFFERELPCILAVLPRLSSEVRTIVIDGYVELDDHGTPGLGAHLFAALESRCAVVGVAKTAYAGSSFAKPVLRGTSTRPLYVTSTGIPLDQAASLVGSMHGRHRIPTLLDRVDRLARGDRPR